MDNKIYVLDTNVLLCDPTCLTAFDDNVVAITSVVLEELDDIKTRNNDVARDARAMIRTLSGIITGKEQQVLSSTGVKLCEYFPHANPSAVLRIVAEVQRPTHQTTNDLRIIAITDKLQQSADNDVILVSRDINMRLLATSAGVIAEDYRTDKTDVRDSDHIRTGHHVLPESFFDGTATVEVIDTGKTGATYKFSVDLAPNANVPDYLYASVHDNETLLQVSSISDGFIYANTVPISAKCSGIKPKNVFQLMAMRSMLSTDVDLTVLLGPAGTGKSLLAIATALELTMEKRKYKRIIFTRTQDSQFDDIGFLPGTEHDKVLPWVGAAIDSLEWLYRGATDQQKAVEYILDRYLSFKALNFIRGRSFTDTILIIDEAQNLTASQMKTILTRAGENCKIILMGNLAQIDSKYVTPVSSGLTYVTEKFRGCPFANIVQLEGVVRSRLADFSENNL